MGGSIYIYIKVSLYMYIHIQENPTEILENPTETNMEHDMVICFMQGLI